MNFSDVFFDVSPCSGTPWFTEYTSQISMSNASFYFRGLKEGLKKRSENQDNEGQAIVIETVPKKTENSILRNQKKSESLIFTGPKIFAGR
jgi:hypothetical protein